MRQKKLRQPPYCETCVSIHEKRSVLHGFRFEPCIWESYVGTEGRLFWLIKVRERGDSVRKAWGRQVRKNACKAFLGASGKENRHLQAERFVVTMRNSCLKNFKAFFLTLKFWVLLRYRKAARLKQIDFFAQPERLCKRPSPRRLSGGKT